MSPNTNTHPTSRQEAKDTGARFYRGTVCIHRHEGGIRYASTGCCVECDKANNRRPSKRRKGRPRKEEYEAAL